MPGALTFGLSTTAFPMESLTVNEVRAIAGFSQKTGSDFGATSYTSLEAMQNESSLKLFGVDSAGAFVGPEEMAPAPEPATWFGALLAISILIWNQRRRFLQLGHWRPVEIIRRLRRS